MDRPTDIRDDGGKAVRPEFGYSALVILPPRLPHPRDGTATQAPYGLRSEGDTTVPAATVVDGGS